MNLFFKKSIFLLFLITSIVLFIVLLKVRFFGLDILSMTSKDRTFGQKLIEFKNFKEKRKSINLVLGSSLARSINSLQLGRNWFNFSNAHQNIYNSYKFVEFQSKTVKIDSIFISIQNTDLLPRANYNKIDWSKPNVEIGLNNKFYIFERKKSLEIIKKVITNFFNSLKMTRSDLISVFKNESEDKKDYRSGFYFNTTVARNLDSLYTIDRSLAYRHNQYFSFLSDSLDTFWIERFQSMCDSLGIKVFFISTPKSKYYHLNLKDNNYKVKNEVIKKTLKSLPINYSDYEEFTVTSDEKGFFKDETHMAALGARVFTKRISIDFLENYNQSKSHITKPIVFIGSSSIRNWNIDHYFKELPTINSGFNGSDITDVNFFIEETVLNHKPSKIMFYAGDNDITYGKSPKQLLNDFIDFVRATHSVLPHAKIIYISIKPSPRRWGLWSEMRIANDLVKNYSSNDSLLSYVDISSSMLGSNGKPKPSLFLNDSLHLSQSGYLLWSKILKPYLLAENK